MEGSLPGLASWTFFYQPFISTGPQDWLMATNKTLHLSMDLNGYTRNIFLLETISLWVLNLSPLKWPQPGTAELSPSSTWNPEPRVPSKHTLFESKGSLLPGRWMSAGKGHVVLIVSGCTPSTNKVEQRKQPAGPLGVWAFSNPIRSKSPQRPNGCDRTWGKFSGTDSGRQSRKTCSKLPLT